ncbi:hypothetical protein EJ04DRAFT_558392 [Polyplosphaeria fusca]|uniref:C3H1-type domain-containing protein n=1 Tax=Polyplosphaeria fusca TaxID=682080 RepID=A0A9P4V9X1_9PLEO|nr:hypothetical protein EJ04DRAFT_558392 [Polyplosphaeria fusca]
MDARTQLLFETHGGVCGCPQIWSQEPSAEVDAVCSLLSSKSAISSQISPLQSHPSIESSQTLAPSFNDPTDYFATPTPEGPPKSTCIFWYHGITCKLGTRCRYAHECHITWPVCLPQNFTHKHPCHRALCPLKMGGALAVMAAKKSNTRTKEEMDNEMENDYQPGEYRNAAPVFDSDTSSTEEESSDSNCESSDDEPEHMARLGQAPKPMKAVIASISHASTVRKELPTTLPRPPIPLPPKPKRGPTDAVSKGLLTTLPPPLISLPLKPESSCAGTVRKELPACFPIKPERNSSGTVRKRLLTALPPSLIPPPPKPEIGPTSSFCNEPKTDFTQLIPQPPAKICFDWYHTGACTPRFGQQCFFMHGYKDRAQEVSLPRGWQNRHDPECELELCPVRITEETYGNKGKGKGKAPVANGGVEHGGIAGPQQQKVGQNRYPRKQKAQRKLTKNAMSQLQQPDAEMEESEQMRRIMKWEKNRKKKDQRRRMRERKVKEAQSAPRYKLRSQKRWDNVMGANMSK